MAESKRKSNVAPMDAQTMLGYFFSTLWPLYLAVGLMTFVAAIWGGLIEADTHHWLSANRGSFNKYHIEGGAYQKYRSELRFTISWIGLALLLSPFITDGVLAYGGSLLLGYSITTIFLVLFIRYRIKLLMQCWNAWKTFSRN